jgi:hypothetical protein
MSIGFVVDKAAMRQVFLLVPHFLNISHHFTSATYLFSGQMYSGAINLLAPEFYI